MAHRRERSLDLALLLSVVAVAGCSGSQSSQTAQYDPNDSNIPTLASTAPPPSSSGDDKPKGDGDETALTDDQRGQMEVALRRGGDKASNCASVVPDAPRGEGEIKVTFDGKKGRAVEVSVGSPWAGTPVESCIQRAFVGEIIVPFDGELEVPYTVKLAAKGEAKDPKAKDAKDAKDPKAKDPKDKGKKK